MPEKKGTETIRDFRKEFPSVPIIAMSAEEEWQPFTAKELGAAVILRKPFDMNDLLQSVRAVLNGRPRG